MIKLFLNLSILSKSDIFIFLSRTLTSKRFKKGKSYNHFSSSKQTRLKFSKFLSYISFSALSSLVKPSFSSSSLQKVISTPPDSNFNKFNWVSKDAPYFKISGEDVEIIPGPVEFYNKLKEMINKAEKRVSLATLYVGTGPKEKELVKCLKNRLKKKKSLKVNIILDYLRGTRGRTNNSITMLLPLKNITYKEDNQISCDDGRNNDNNNSNYNKVYKNNNNNNSNNDLYIDKIFTTFNNHTNKSNFSSSNISSTSSSSFSSSFFTSASTFSSPSSTFFSSTSPPSSYPDCNVFFYHTPDFRGHLKSLLPQRMNEVVGLFHIKVYIIDDQLIISGANLSETYFTDRQDRYLLIRNSKELCDYFDQLLNIISNFSFILTKDGKLVYESENHHPLNGKDKNQNFREQMRNLVENLINEHMNKNNNINKNDKNNNNQTVSKKNKKEKKLDTIIYPLIQMGPIGIQQDRIVTEKIFKSTNNNHALYLASGYFNLTDEYVNILFNNSKASFFILTASPPANSFYKSPGLSYYIPIIYTNILKNFHNLVAKKQEEERIKLYEYNKDKWTVHAKGVWIYNKSNNTTGTENNINITNSSHNNKINTNDINKENFPFLTMVGSPNYGHRSVERDLEAQLVILTENKNLQRCLHQEKNNLFKHTYEVDDTVLESEEREIPLMVKLIAPFIKNFF